LTGSHLKPRREKDLDLREQQLQRRLKEQELREQARGSFVAGGGRSRGGGGGGGDEGEGPTVASAQGQADEILEEGREAGKMEGAGGAREGAGEAGKGWRLPVAEAPVAEAAARGTLHMSRVRVRLHLIGRELGGKRRGAGGRDARMYDALVIVKQVLS